MDAYLGDCELYCPDCAECGMDSYPDGGGEADTPQHCAGCGIPLENPLTGDGIGYVLEAIATSMAEPEDQRNRIMDHEDGVTTEWYHGSRHVEIVRDWAKQLRDDYGLDADDERAVDDYLTATMSPAERTVNDWRERGFDRSRIDGAYARVGCSQCEALVIQGVPCHETGCPNVTNRWEDHDDV